jgi:hypothetical protein
MLVSRNAPTRTTSAALSLADASSALASLAVNEECCRDGRALFLGDGDGRGDGGAGGAASGNLADAGVVAERSNVARLLPAEELMSMGTTILMLMLPMYTRSAMTGSSAVTP